MRYLTIASYVLTLTMIVLLPNGCRVSVSPDCNRAGCDAIAQPRSGYSISRGIAGSVAMPSDVIVNGCQQCGFSSAVLSTWTTTMPVTDQIAAQSIFSGPAGTSFIANSSYETELSPGYYLVCAYPQCASVTITESGVTTVNVRNGQIGSSLIVFEPGSTTSRTDGIFDVN